MPSTRPILGCVRSTVGIGFIHTCLMGIFLATPTYLVSPVDFAANPHIRKPDIMAGDTNIVEEAIDRLPIHKDNENATDTLDSLKTSLQLPPPPPPLPLFLPPPPNPSLVNPPLLTLLPSSSPYLRR